MLSITKNEHGYAIVYGLVVLLLASVGGTGLLFMTRQGHIGATDYAKIRTSSQAAIAALKACEGQFLNDPATALEILKKYTEDNDYKWLLGDETNSNTEQRIKFRNESNSPQYSARILGFDETNYLIKIEGIGYGGSGGKKRAFASYQLQGLAKSGSSFKIDHALYLGGQMINCNVPLSINGNMYLSTVNSAWDNDQHFNSGGTINGNFKTAYNATSHIDIGAHLKITGTAFIQCNLKIGALLEVGSKAGFTGSYDYWNVPMQLSDDAYFISPPLLANILSKTNIVVQQESGKTVTYSSPVVASWFTGFNSVNQNNSQTRNSIATSLGETVDAELPLDYSIPTWGSGVVQEVSGGIDSATLENYWQAHESAGTLYQDKWLVIKMTGDVSGNGEGFTRKVIWIVSDWLSFNGTYFDCSDESNTLFIVTGHNSKVQIKIPENSNFRGLIYVNSNNPGGSSYEFYNNSIFYGAIHHANESTIDLKKGNNCDSARIYFTDPIAQSALDEIAETGLILKQGAAATPSEGDMYLIDNKIRPVLLGMQL